VAVRAPAVAAPAPARRRRSASRPAARSTPARRPATRSSAGLLNGVIWIAALAVVLGGVVALNVAVLQLNVRLDRLVQEQADLRAGNAALSAQLSSVGAPPHVASVAHRKLGLVPAAPEQTEYVQLPPR
jgi:cell division protein FtsL